MTTAVAVNEGWARTYGVCPHCHHNHTSNGETCSACIESGGHEGDPVDCEACKDARQRFEERQRIAAKIEWRNDLARTKLGSIFTDTAMLLIGDPCKVLYSTDDEERNHFTWESYVDLCGDFCQKVVEISDILGRAGALSVQVGSDGWYPVYLETDEEGKPARLVIELGGKVEP